MDNGWPPKPPRRPSSGKKSKLARNLEKILKIDENKILCLRNHSLNSVISSCNFLWCTLLSWFWLHLKALDVEFMSDAEMESLREPHLAVIPFVEADGIKSLANLMMRKHLPHIEDGGWHAMFDMLHYGPDKDLEELIRLHCPNGESPFINATKKPMQLLIGKRALDVGEIYYSDLDGYRLYYFDAYMEWHMPPWIDISEPHPSNVYNPCAVGWLLCIAQEHDTGDDSVVTRLLMTHRADDGGMHVYTAQVSQLLLKRFRHPNRPTKFLTNAWAESSNPDSDDKTVPPLFKLHHQRVPFEPLDTFQRRVLAAMSITVTFVGTSCVDLDSA